MAAGFSGGKDGRDRFVSWMRFLDPFSEAVCCHRECFARYGPFYLVASDVRTGGAADLFAGGVPITEKPADDADRLRSGECPVAGSSREVHDILKTASDLTSADDVRLNISIICMYPKISVIVPVYNTDRYLRRCVESILSQTFTDFELLLIDDGSKDQSGAICDEYADGDARVRVFHKANGGVSSARNVGLDHARGEWITFCDSDDWVYPIWLENFLPGLGRYDLGVQSFRISYPFEPSRPAQNVRFNYQGAIREGLVLLYEHECVGYLWVKIFRRDLIRQHNIRFDEEFALWEDEDFLLFYASVAQTIFCTQAIGYHYMYPQYVYKYRYVDRLPITRSLYLRAVILYEDTSNKMLNYYLNLYTDAVFNAYMARLPNRIVSLRIYRQNVGAHVLKTRLFFFSRWLIYLDWTCLFASCILNIHSRIKSLHVA